MDKICTNFINQRVCYDEYNGEITVPKTFEIYKEDFGGKDSNVIEWIWNYFSAPVNPIDYILEKFRNKNIFIRYSDEA